MGDPGVPDLGRGEARRGARVEKATKGLGLEAAETEAGVEQRRSVPSG